MHVLGKCAAPFTGRVLSVGIGNHPFNIDAVMQFSCMWFDLGVTFSFGLQLSGPLGVHAVASGFNSMLQCLMWPVVRLYEGWPYNWSAWGCVTPLHQRSCAAWS